MAWFVEYFFKTTIVLTLALLAAAASRRRPAAFRHFVLSFALVGLILLPLLSLFPVGWRTSLLPMRPSETGGQERNRDPMSRLPLNAGLPIIAPFPTAQSRFGPDPEVLSGWMSPGKGSRPGEYASPPPSLKRAFGPGRERGQAPGRGILDIAPTALWSAGVVLLILRLAFGLAGAVKMTAEGAALGDSIWRSLLERFQLLLSLKRRIRIKSHPKVIVPLTWGWRKPVILMPAGVDAWKTGERSSVLLHELSHIKRADFLVTLFVRISLAFFWFNPLCWIVHRELRKEQEIACDELVLRAGIRPSVYAASLLSFRRAAGFRWNPSAALLGMVGNSSFQQRLAAILKQKLTFKEVRMKTKVMLGASVVLAVALIGTARPAVGVENKAAMATVVETAIPDSAPLDIALPVDQTQEKPSVGKKIVIMPGEPGKRPIEITITEGDKVKKLVLLKPLTITLDKKARVLVLSSEGKEIQILKGEPLRLEIRGGTLEFLKEGKHVHLETAEAAAPGAQVVHVIKEGKDERGDVKIILESKEKGGPITLWTVKEPDQEKGVWVGKEISEKPHAFYLIRDKELLEKVREIRKEVEAVKANKADFTALETLLANLEAELKANEGKALRLALKHENLPVALALDKRVPADEARIAVKIMDKEDLVSEIKIEGKTGKDRRELYDRAAARLKKELPVGYALEPEFDEESGTMTFRIKASDGKKDNKLLLIKLVEILKEEIKK